jgi:hypothetical protein
MVTLEELDRIEQRAREWGGAFHLSDDEEKRIIATARAYLEGRQNWHYRAGVGIPLIDQPPQQREDDLRMQGVPVFAEPSPDAGLVERLRGKYSVVESEPTLCDEAADALELKIEMINQLASRVNEARTALEAKDAEIAWLKSEIDFWEGKEKEAQHTINKLKGSLKHYAGGMKDASIRYQEAQAEIERLREALEKIRVARSDEFEQILEIARDALKEAP